MAAEDNSINDALTMRPGGEGALGRIDQYELVRELGGGGFGTVYLARDTVSGVDYAVKGLPPMVRNSREEMENVRANFALVARLGHTNIARAYVLHPAKDVRYADADVRRKLRVDSGDTLMVMEYAPGVTLSKWRRQFPEGKVPPAQALEIVRQVAAALDYAHGQRILHRDVKPANIMVETKTDGELVARVLDFGLAAEIRSSMGRVSREIHDTSGTRPYMAPEQWTGGRQGPATDQYALAALFYELVTGDVPFASVFETGDPTIMLTVVTTRPPVIPADLPEPMRQALEKALAKKPEDRFPSCTAFVAALEDRSSRERSRLSRPLGGARSRATAKVILAVAALALAVAGGWWWSTRQSLAPAGTTGVSPVATDPTTRSDSESERRKNVPVEGREFMIRSHSLFMKMKWCPKGKFVMGSPTTEAGRDDDEKQHVVTLTKGFWMGETEVTQGQWKQLMNGETVVDLARKGLQDDTLYPFSEGKKTLRDIRGMAKDGDPGKLCADLDDDVPVYNVSWDEAARFCRRLTAKERAGGRIPDGYEYRLPTEAEWEYACRAGETAALPNGEDIRIIGENNAPALDDIAWYGGNSSKGFKGRSGWKTDGWKEKQYPGGNAGPCEVKGRQPNNWGLYDMIGNVWEWCGDTYGSYPDGLVRDPYNDFAEGAYRVRRGGSWIDYARFCRPANRGRDSPGFRSNNLGFRVALAPSH